MTNTIVAALTIGATVRIDNAHAPDYGRTGEIIAVHFAETASPSYVVQPNGADYCRTYGAGELVVDETFTTIATAQILDQLCEVVDAARASGQLTPSWSAALDAAYGWLLQQDTIEFDHLGHALRVESATKSGKFYTSNGDCQCLAFTAGNGTCWHRAAARLVRRALARDAELQRTAAQTIADRIAESREELLARADTSLISFAAAWDAMALRAKISHTRAQRWAATEELMSELYA